MLKEELSSSGFYDIVWLKRKQIPIFLKDLNITEEYIDAMAKTALAAGSTAVNPRKPSLDEIKTLYRKIM